MDEMKRLVDHLVERRIDRRQFLRRAMALGLSLPAASAIIAACSPAATPTTAPAPEATKPAPTTAPAQPAGSPAAAASPAAGAAGQVDIDKLVEGAKQEGALVWIDASVQKSSEEAFHAAFKQKYGLPDSFQITHVLKGTGDIATQVQQETQSGNVTNDLVWLGNVPFFEGLKTGGHLLEAPSDEYKAIESMVSTLKFPSDPPYWYTTHSYAFVPVWNKTFIDKNYQSWQDLLDPDLKGQTIQGDIRTSSTQTDTYIGLRTVLDADYFQQYKDLTDPILVFRTAEQQQKITTGERPLSNFQISGRAFQAHKEDPSLTFGVAFPTEGTVPLPIPLGVLAKAPHPNAGYLFMEFLMSKEGQQIWLDYECQWPLRTDVTYSQEVSEYLQPLDKIKVITMDWDNITSQDRDEARAEFRRIFQVS